MHKYRMGRVVSLKNNDANDAVPTVHYSKSITGKSPNPSKSRQNRVPVAQASHIVR
jgi:hypothetical protein